MNACARMATCVFFSMIGLFSLASDHKEAPRISETPPADIADLYAFLSPEDSTKLVLVMTTNPFSVPSEGVAFNFSPRFKYRFHIDNDGDAREENVITFDFAPDQSYRAVFPGDVVVTGQATAPTEEVDANDAMVTTSGEIKVFAGPRDDPFFFDVVGYFRFLAGTGAFTGSDGFAGYNTSAIVVELPVSMLAGEGSTLNVWASTFTPFHFKRASNIGRQYDRVGNPAVATVLIPPDLKDAYNFSSPDKDADKFAGAIVASLTALGTSAENIGILASVAVPDVLTIDVSAPTGFPNGRGLSDDVIDVLLGLILNNPEIGDGVDANDAPFLGEFPYLAPPWQPE